MQRPNRSFSVIPQDDTVTSNGSMNHGFKGDRAQVALQALHQHLRAELLARKQNSKSMPADVFRTRSSGGLDRVCVLWVS